MPGIAAMIGSTSTQVRRDRLGAMLKPMLHEPFYTSGSIEHEDLECGVGWVCHPGGFSDCMPVWNEAKDVCLIFTGEDFPEETSLDGLKSKGHVFAGRNASNLVHLYEDLGIRFLEKINGWFSGILMDFRERKIILFNDRYGVNRIYHHQSGNVLYFSSEAKSLLKVLPELRQIDPQGLGEFVSCGCVLQGRTLYQGVTLLPPGSVWTFRPGQPVRKETYFRREEWESLPQLSPEDYYQRLKETFTRILPRYLNGSQPVALSLTGGVDSRMILACAPRAAGSLPCYTFGGRFRDCADVKISRQIAGICRQPYQTISVGVEFLRNFPGLAEKTVYISDGAMDVTGAIDLYVQGKAREVAPVRISGVYGGEILRRLVMFKPSSLKLDFFSPDFIRSIDGAAKTYADELDGHKLSFTAFKQAPWYMTPKFAVERSQVTMRTPYFDNELVSLAYQTPRGMVSSNNPSLRLITDGNPALTGVPTDRGLKFRSIPVVTRAANLYQEFTFKAEYAYDYGMPQWLARLDHAFSPLRLERLFLGRHKFHHFRVFYRDELATYLKDVLLDSRTRSRSYLEGARLEGLVNSHIKGNRNYTTEIHKILSAELIHRQLIENA
jgi:asparagine synthase (glutamine-hydrolysing)